MGRENEESAAKSRVHEEPPQPFGRAVDRETNPQQIAHNDKNATEYIMRFAVMARTIDDIDFGKLIGLDTQRNRREAIHKASGNKFIFHDFAAIGLQSAAAIVHRNAADEPDQRVGNL